MWETVGDRSSRSGGGYVGNRGAVIQALREQSGISTATPRAEVDPTFAVADRSVMGSSGGCCRITLVDVDAQRPRQGLQTDPFHDIGPAVVERQYGLGTPNGDASLQRADLTIRKLARIALLQLVEDRSAIPLRLCNQPLADLVPHGVEGVLARAVQP